MTKKTLIKEQAIELCGWLKIINIEDACRVMQRHPERFNNLYNLYLFKHRSDTDYYNRNNINYCKSPDPIWDFGR